MNSRRQTRGIVGSVEAGGVSGRSDTWQVAGFLVVVSVAVAVGILVAFTHVMLPHWMASMNLNGQAFPAVIQHLIWIHHLVLTHWKIAIFAFVLAIAVGCFFGHDGTEHSHT